MSEQVTPAPSGMHVLTVRMPAEMLGELSRRARKRGVPVSELVREAVRHDLGEWRDPIVQDRPNPGNFFLWGPMASLPARPSLTRDEPLAGLDKGLGWSAR